MSLAKCINCAESVDVDECRIIQQDSHKILVIDRNGMGRTHTLRTKEKDDSEVQEKVGPAAAKLARLLARQAAREQKEQHNDGSNTAVDA